MHAMHAVVEINLHITDYSYAPITDCPMRASRTVKIITGPLL